MGYVLFFVLLIMAFFSLRLAWSGFVPGRTYVGWAYLLVYLVITIEFVATWMRNHPDPFSQLGGGVVGALLFSTQTPLVVELISQMVMPDPSKGLKLLKVHAEAERLVAQEDIRGAIAEYERIIEMQPDDWIARCRLAELRYEVEDYKEAAQAYEAYLEQVREISMADHCFTLTRLSEIYANHLKDLQNARARLRTIIEKYPDTKYATYAQDHLETL